MWICLLTALATLATGYPVAYALVHARSRLAKSFILIVVVTPLFLGEVVRTYSWIIVLGNNGFVNAMLLKAGLIEKPLQLMFTTFGVVVALVHVTLPVMVIMLAAVLIISGLMNFLRRDVAYAMVILWALAGIAFKFPQAGIVTIAIWVTFGLVAASLVAAFLVIKNPA